ncbi:MAG: S24/S26 family peptidase, partial [Clostridia bacterium]|nr:S24/S26 family peptidase [Clostridia bacterium]
MKPEFKCVPMEELSPLIVGLIEEGVDVTITVTGNSMRPMLTHRKDTVVLTKCDPLALKRGDLPLYKRDNGQYILHRIIRVHKDTYDM